MGDNVSDRGRAVARIEFSGRDGVVTANRERAAIVIPALVTLVLTAVASIRIPPWRDEVASLSFARLDITDLMSAVSHVDTVLAPYYFLSHAVQLVLPGEFGLRLPSVLAAIAATALVGAVASLVGRRRGTGHRPRRRPEPAPGHHGLDRPPLRPGGVRRRGGRWPPRATPG